MSARARAALGEASRSAGIGQPRTWRGAALFLASAASSWTTGVTIDIAGGKMMV